MLQRTVVAFSSPQDKGCGCRLLERRCNPPRFRHDANRLSAELAGGVDFKHLFVWIVVVGSDVVSLQGEDGVTPSKQLVFFLPQAVWMFWLLLLRLSEAMKAACWLTTTSAAVWHSDTPSFVASSQTTLRSVSCWDASCFSCVYVRTKTHSCLFLSLGLRELHRSLNWLLQDYEKWGRLSNGSFSTTAISACYSVCHTFKKG